MSLPHFPTSENDAKPVAKVLQQGQGNEPLLSLSTTVGSSKEQESVDNAVLKDGSCWDRLCKIIDSRFIAGLTPAYFVSVMGTGITANILYNFPYFGQWLRVCSYIMFAIAFIFFIVLTFFTVVSIFIHPQKWTTFHRDTAVAPFMGTFVMGYITLVNMLFNFTGKDFIIGVWVFWWISVFLSLYTAFVVFFTGMISKNKSRPLLPAANLHATLLLPIVTLTVAASSGSIMTPDLPSNNTKIITMLVCYLMWCIAIFLATVIITIHHWKLFVYKIPPTNVVFTSFLPVGVMGHALTGSCCLE